MNDTDARSSAQKLADAAVERGFALLEAKDPGVFLLANPDTLVIESLEECVLAQIYGDYHRGLEILEIDDVSAMDYGFNLSAAAGYDCNDLRDAWGRKLVAMRSAA